MKTKATWLFCIVLLSSLSLAQSLPVVNAVQQLTLRSASPRIHVADQYAKLPMSFEANQGQTDPQVKFLSRGNGYSVFLTPTEAVLALKNNKGTNPIRMRLMGADRDPKVSGLDESTGKSNYFSGKNSAKWRTNIAQYAKIRYRAVYPGIDLVYYGSQRQLEHDFIIAPGANPNRISIAIDGAAKLNINEDGDLLLDTVGGQIRFQKPLAYQIRSGERYDVAAEYVLHRNQIAFRVGSYDHTRELTIDPVISYATYLGGSGYDSITRMAVDTAGNVYVAGTTGSIDFPTVAPIRGTFGGGSQDAFVAKLNSTGSALIYATYLGGNGSKEGAGGIAVDATGNAYICGTTDSTDFPVMNAFQPVFGGGVHNGFVTKLNSAGSSLIYSTYLGGNGTGDAASAIAVDSSGNAYVAGEAASFNFPTTPGAFQTTGGGYYQDAFFTKFGPSGSLLYSTYLGGTGGLGGDVANGIAVDSLGYAYLTGYTDSTDFPTTLGAYDTTCGTDGTCNGGFAPDAFVAKIAPAGNGTADLIYSTYLGGSSIERGYGIAVDSAVNAYVTGQTCSTDFPVQNAFQAAYGGGACSSSSDGDVFVTKLNPAGSALVFSTYLGGSGDENPGNLSLDSATGDIYVVGSTPSFNFPILNAFQPQFAGGAHDAFVSKFSSAGGLLYSSFLGGNGDDGAGAIAVNATGVYVAGSTNSTNLATSGVFQSSLASDPDGFVTKITETGAPQPAISVSPTQITFPPTPINTRSVPVTVTITNSGTAGLLISDISTQTPFAIINPSSNIGASIPQGGTASFDMIFTPTASGPFSGNVTILSNAPSSPTVIPLQGSVVTTGQPGIAVTPNPITFPPTSLARTSSISITIGNPGTAVLQLSDISVTQPFFLAGPPSATSVPAGGQAILNVLFAAKGPGPFSGNLVIVSNASTSPTVIPLQGAVTIPEMRFDAIPNLTDGPRVVTDTNALENLITTIGRAVQGISADGVAQIVFAIPANRRAERLALTVLNDQNSPSGSANDDGVLGNLGQNLSNVGASTLLVSAVDTGHGPMAFAVYRAPVDFVRSSVTCANTPTVSGTDCARSSRSVSVQVKSSDVATFAFTVPITILRPMVVLVHGLWETPTDWSTFAPLILTKDRSPDARFSVKLADYSQPFPITSSSPSYSSNVFAMMRRNAMGFDFNANRVLTETRQFIVGFKNGDNPASIMAAGVQVDIVSHSMGGDIARTMVLKSSFLSDDTFAQGTIHKLITIGTPHLGTPLATNLLQPNNSCVRDLLAHEGSISLSSANVAGTTIRGGVGDLRGNLTGTGLSEALKSLTKMSRHLRAAMIAGVMSQPQLNNLKTCCAALTIQLICGANPLAASLTPEGWPAVVGNLSDAIVPLNSQVAGLQGPHATAVHSGGAVRLGFGPTPTEFDGASGIAIQVIRLLNTPITSASFSLLSP